MSKQLKDEPGSALTADIVDHIKVNSSLWNEIKSNGLVLADDTVIMVNNISLHVMPDLPALVIQLGESTHIHQALNLSLSPISQGQDEDSSLLAFREWLLSHARESAGFHLESPASGNMKVFGIRGLSCGECMDISFNRWLSGLLPWIMQIKAAVAGKVVTLLSITCDYDTNDIHLLHLMSY